jgi:hypothetical protein
MGQKKREIDLTLLAWAALDAIIRDMERQQDPEKQKEAAG